MDNAIREFSLAKPSWYMSHYTMIYKNGERMRNFWAFLVLLQSSFLYFGAFLIKQLFHSRLLAIYHLISNARSWNNKHLMTGPEGNSEFCFPRISMFPDKFWITRWDSSNSGQHFAGNSELFPVWRHSFRNVARSWHLAGNSFIVRCHVTMN